MDRHQPHGVQALGLERGLAFAGLGEVAGLGVGEEAAQVAALGALVLAGQAHQLAQVREPAVAAGAGERRQVVAGGDDRALEQHLERRALGVLALGGQQARHAAVRRLDGVPQAAAGVAVLGQLHQLVRVRAVEGRGEDGQQRLLVMRVGEHAQPGEAVADLLLAPVAAAADHVRGQALLLERFLEQAQGRGRADEHDHVAGAPAAVELGAQAVGEQARLGAPPGLVSPLRQAEPRRQLVPPLRAGDEQLDGRLPLRRADVEQPQRPVLVDAELLAAGLQRREALAQLRAEGGVEDVQQLLAAAEVDRQAANLARVELGRAAAEDVHVGVAEAVDRLELVADREQVVALQRPQDAELDRVRVLELVDHDQLEALRPLGARRLVVQKVAGAQLEVVEVDRRPLGLRVVVGRAVAVQQRVDQRQRPPAWKSAHRAR